MKRVLYIATVTSLTLGFAPMIAQAGQMLTVTFSNISNNSGQAASIATQLKLEILDKDQASDDYGITIGTNDVLFIFTNAVGIASSVREIYLDDGAVLGQVQIHNSIGGYTDFTGGGAEPGNLPGGASLTPPFVATASFSADAQGNPSKGIDTSSDILGIQYSTKTYLDMVGFDAISAAVGNGDLRIGLHVTSIGLDDESDSFVNDGPAGGPSAIPEPASAVLLCCGCLSLIGTGCLRRRKDIAAA